MKQKLLLARITPFVFAFFLLFFYWDAHPQYVFKQGDIREKISLHPYTSIVKLGQNDLGFDAVVDRFDALNPKKLKSENDDLGFTDGHFWTRTILQNDTDSE